MYVSRNATPGSPLLLLMSLVPRLMTTACGATWKSQSGLVAFVTARSYSIGIVPPVSPP